MSETNHVVNIIGKWQGKDAEAGMKKYARDAHKLTADNKKAMTNALKVQKQQNQVGGPANTKKVTDELKKQNREIERKNKLLERQNKLMSEQNRLAAGGRGGGRGGDPKGRYTFGGGFNRAMGFSNGGRNQPNWRARAGSALGGGLRAGIGMAGGGLAALATMPFAAVSSDYQAYFTYMRAMGGLSGLNKGAPFGAGLTQPGVNDLARNKMTQLGYSPEETLQAVRQFSRSTGNGGDAERGMTAARVLGLDTGEVSGMFGELRRGGGGFGEKGFKDFQKILQAAVKGGVDASTLPEYLEGVKSFVQGAGGVSGGAVNGLPMAQILSLFGQSGIAGLQGARGAAIANKFDAAIKGPGGGEEGRAFILNTLGFGKAGGGASYYEATKQQELGLSGTGGASLIKQMIDNADRINGSKQEANLYLDKVTGISLDYLEKIRDAFDKGDQEKVDQLLQSSTATELDVLKSIDDNMKGFLGASKRAADVQVKDITRGESYAAAVEDMQDMMHRYLMTTMPLVQKTLEGVDSTMKMLEPAIENLVHFLEDPAGFTTAGATSMRESMDMRKEAWSLEGAGSTVYSRASRGGSYTNDELSEAIVGLVQASQLQQQSADSPSAIANEIATALVNTIPGVSAMSDADRAVAQSQQDLARAVALLDRLADQMGRGSEINPEDIHTRRELIAAMTGLGIAIPPGARGRVDATGGSP